MSRVMRYLYEVGQRVWGSLDLRFLYIYTEIPVVGYDIVLRSDSSWGLEFWNGDRQILWAAHCEISAQTRLAHCA